MKYILIQRYEGETFTAEANFTDLSEVVDWLYEGQDNHWTIQVLLFTERPNGEVENFVGDVSQEVANILQAKTWGHFVADGWQGNLDFHPIIQKAADYYLEESVADALHIIDMRSLGKLPKDLERKAEELGL